MECVVRPGCMSGRQIASCFSHFSLCEHVRQTWQKYNLPQTVKTSGAAFFGAIAARARLRKLDAAGGHIITTATWISANEGEPRSRQLLLVCILSS